MTANGNYWTRKATRRRFLAGSGAAGVGLGAMALAGCGDDDSGGKTSTASPAGGTGTASAGATTPAGSATTGTQYAYQRHHVFEDGNPAPKQGGTLTLVTNDPDSFDVYAGAGGYAKGIAQSIYNHPWRAHFPTGSKAPFYEGDLVEKWEQPDPSTWVLHMRQGVNWQNLDPVNGRAFVADDMAKNITRMMTNQPQYSLHTRLQMIDSVTATDEKTVQIKLKWPYGYFIYNLADQDSTIIAPELFDGKAKTTAVGTGPFVLSDWQKGSAVILKKNPNYWDKGLPYIDQIQYVVQNDFATNVANFIAGKLDVFSLLTPESEADIRKSNPKAVLWYTVAYPFVGALNTTSDTQPALKDVRVRQAIKFATDYDAEIKLGFGGHGYRAQPLSRIHGANGLPESELPKRDVAKAKQLLSDAGVSNLKIVDSISNLVIPDQGHTQWVNALKEAGIDMTLDVSPFNQWITKAFIQGQMEACSTGLFSFIPPDVQLSVKWESTGAYNNSHFKDPNWDADLQKARQELDLVKAQPMFQALSRTILDQSPDIFLLENQQLVGKQGRVKNWIFQDGWWSGANMWWDVAWLDG